MVKLALSAVLAMAVLTTAAPAQQRLSGSGCPVPERLLLPAHQRAVSIPANRLVGWIYDLNRATAVLKEGTCSCDTFLPSWEGALAEFETRFGALPERQGTPLWVRKYGERSRAAFEQARSLCFKQGVF